MNCKQSSFRKAELIKPMGNTIDRKELLICIYTVAVFGAISVHYPRQMSLQ